MFNEYPYRNISDLNIDYILNAIKTFQNEVTNFVSINAIKYANPIQWNITSQYEKNTIVIDPQSGTAYISVEPVPKGVSLTRQDYWTVVFDLERFVTRANNNFTTRVEDQTTLTATFPTSKGQWVVWDGVLYKAISNIVAGDQYVVNSNIERITVEEVKNQVITLFSTMIGNLDDLETENKDNIVSAINELLTVINNVVTNLENETTARVNADILLQDNIDDEVTARVNADILLQDNIDDEVTARENADIQLQNNIDDEAQARQSADNQLQNIINEMLVTYHGVYIDPINGDDDNDGLSQSTPMKTVNAALLKYTSGSVNIFPMQSGEYEVSVSIEGLYQFEMSNPLGIADVTFNVSNYAESKRLKFGSNSDSVGCTFNLTGYAINPANCRIEIYHATIKGDLKPQACNVFISESIIDVAYTASQGENLFYNCTFNHPISISYGRLRTNGNFVFNSSSDDSGNAYIFLNGAYWDCPNPTNLSGTQNGTFTYGILLSGGMITFASKQSASTLANLLGTIHSYRGIIAKGAVEITKDCPEGNDVRFQSGVFQNYIVASDSWNSVSGQVRYSSGHLQYYDGSSQSWVTIS